MTWPFAKEPLSFVEEPYTHLATCVYSSEGLDFTLGDNKELEEASIIDELVAFLQRHNSKPRLDFYSFMLAKQSQVAVLFENLLNLGLVVQDSVLAFHSYQT